MQKQKLGYKKIRGDFREEFDIDIKALEVQRRRRRLDFGQEIDTIYFRDPKEIFAEGLAGMHGGGALGTRASDRFPRVKNYIENHAIPEIERYYKGLGTGK